MDNKQVTKLADLMFEEYNEIAAEYSLEGFDNVDEIIQVIRDNLTSDDVERLLDDERARIAFAGCIIGALAGAEVVIVTSEEGGSGGPTETTH